MLCRAPNAEAVAFQCIIIFPARMPYFVLGGPTSRVAGGISSGKEDRVPDLHTVKSVRLPAFVFLIMDIFVNFWLAGARHRSFLIVLVSLSTKADCDVQQGILELTSASIWDIVRNGGFPPFDRDKHLDVSHPCPANVPVICPGKMTIYLQRFPNLCRGTPFPAKRPYTRRSAFPRILFTNACPGVTYIYYLLNIIIIIMGYTKNLLGHMAGHIRDAQRK